MIRVTLTDACSEILDSDWQTTLLELTSPQGAPMSSASPHFERPVLELFHIADRLFNVFSDVESLSATGDLVGAPTASSDFVGAEASSAVFESRQLARISAMWQNGIFPLVPLDRNDARPLREVLPSRHVAWAAGTVPSDECATLELYVSIPVLGGSDVRTGQWAATGEGVPKRKLQPAEKKKAAPIAKKVARK